MSVDLSTETANVEIPNASAGTGAVAATNEEGAQHKSLHRVKKDANAIELNGES